MGQGYLTQNQPRVHKYPPVVVNKCHPGSPQVSDIIENSLVDGVQDGGQEESIAVWRIMNNELHESKAKHSYSNSSWLSTTGCRLEPSFKISISTGFHCLVLSLHPFSSCVS